MRLNGRGAFVGSMLLVSSVAAAEQGPPPETIPPPPETSIIRRYAVGPKFLIAPGVFIPSTGNAGFSLGVEGGYGFDLGPVRCGVSATPLVPVGVKRSGRGMLHETCLFL